jgi:hypothetical protein
LSFLVIALFFLAVSESPITGKCASRHRNASLVLAAAYVESDQGNFFPGRSLRKGNNAALVPSAVVVETFPVHVEDSYVIVEEGESRIT